MIDTKYEGNPPNDSINNREITLFWKDLTFRIPTKEASNLKVKVIDGKPMKTIVENLSGIARPGEIIGLLGPSGAGKTVFLNMVSSRMRPPLGSIYNRNVYINREIPLTRDIFGKVGAYVMQDDVLLETLTPYECFKFSANLRLPFSPEEKERIVLKVIKDLRLQTCRDTLVRSTIW